MKSLSMLLRSFGSVGLCRPLGRTVPMRQIARDARFVRIQPRIIPSASMTSKDAGRNPKKNVHSFGKTTLHNTFVSFMARWSALTDRFQ